MLPFLLGAAFALVLYPRLGDPAVSFTVFALFIGVAMSVTAFPVLARILDETGLKRTQLGALAIACAAVDDVTAWCLLAFVVGGISSFRGEDPVELKYVSLDPTGVVVFLQEEKSDDDETTHVLEDVSIFAAE